MITGEMKNKVDSMCGYRQREFFPYTFRSICNIRRLNDIFSDVQSRQPELQV